MAKSSYQKLKEKNQQLLNDIKVLVTTKESKFSMAYLDIKHKYKMMFDLEKMIWERSLTPLECFKPAFQHHHLYRSSNELGQFEYDMHTNTLRCINIRYMSGEPIIIKNPDIKDWEHIEPMEPIKPFTY
jgi:hypothetical protein